MPNIRMCSGENCEKKNECYRHRARPSEYRQVWFVGSPIKDGECDHFQSLEGWPRYYLRDVENEND